MKNFILKEIDHGPGFLLVPVILVLIVIVLIFFGRSLQEGLLVFRNKSSNVSDKINDSIVAASSLSLEREIVQLEKIIASKTPKTPYLVINTTTNTFELYKNKALVHRGLCSTGRYVLLDAGENMKWQFTTPKGEFRVRDKIKAPVWKKPDWAFIEEGLPVPSGDHPSRFEYGVLGDYALNLGNGYLIHGTLYKRLLGMPVTHGCIRLDDEDLETVFNVLPVNARIFIL